MSQLQYVLECLAKGEYRLTLHARQRMVERRVSHFDIRTCGENGIVKSQPDGKFKVTGSDLDGEELTLICVEENGILVITVF